MSHPSHLSSEEDTIFRHARDDFLQHLPSDDKAAFIKIHSSTELLDDFNRFQGFVKDHSRWTKVFSAVKDCSDRLQPYFDVVGIVTQSHPEWTAIAWGAFRLVLQVWLQLRVEAELTFVACQQFCGVLRKAGGRAVAGCFTYTGLQ